MPVEVIVPKVDMDMETATIEAWMVAEGQSVQAGDLIFEIATNKAVMEVEAPASGVIHGISGRAGDTFPVGTVVAWIYREGEKPSIASPPATTKREESARSAAAPIAEHPVTATRSATSLRATPLARQLARLNGVDLGVVSGSGPRGRIAASDVLDVVGKSRNNSGDLGIEARPATPAPAPMGTGRLVPFTTLRKLMAERLCESVRTSPHFYMTARVDMSALIALRAQAAARGRRDDAGKLSITVLLACIVGRLLSRHPLLNASVEGEAARLHTGAHIGIAMDRDGELVVPVLRDAHLKPLDQLAADFARLRKAALARTITAGQMRGATFTISNLGMYGVDGFTAIVNPPEAAILAVGRIVETPVGRCGRVVLVPQATLTLSSDHRIVDGVVAARFMTDLRHTVESPELALSSSGLDTSRRAREWKMTTSDQ